MALNFSELGAQPKSRQTAVLFESVNQIQLGAMPPPRYTLLHPAATVTPGDLAIVRRYLSIAANGRPTAPENIESKDSEYRKWLAHGFQARQVDTAPNGIAFMPEYKDWNALSSTDRTDTHTLKLILGNGVAIRAIAENKINPWPDGTTFAKVSWTRDPDRYGGARTGRFEQVAFMIKDRQKYASTAGWGWAQWMGDELKPFGEDAHFAKTCVGCHAPLRSNDYVFTAPIATTRSIQ